MYVSELRMTEVVTALTCSDVTIVSQIVGSNEKYKLQTMPMEADCIKSDALSVDVR